MTPEKLDPAIEALADLLMDLRMDGPAADDWTYQQTMRHYAGIILKDSARREAALREALYNCGLAAHNGGACMDQKIRGGREKLAYIERTASDALSKEPQ